MKIEHATRTYRMRARAEAAARTSRDILAATVALWREQSLDDITLEAIAERAGVSVRTVLRRFGSKEGVFEACLESDMGGAEVRTLRNAAPVGDVARAIGALLAHYERDGDAVLRTLALEDRLDVARQIAARGRAHHRTWCARVFAPFLPPPGDDDHAARLDAFVAATDLYVWKLFRRDLGYSAERTRRALAALLAGLTAPA